MSISAIYASQTPRQRAIYPDGVNVILALLGLGGSDSVKIAALQMFVSDQGMLNYVRRVNQLNHSPEIKSTSAFFFTDQQNQIEATYYNQVRDLVSMFQVNFKDPATVAQLNQWILEHSGFPEVINPADVRDAIAVLINTLWFKDEWVHKFTPRLTRPQPFTRNNGMVVQIPTMVQANKAILYYQNGPITAVQLPFNHGAVAELVLGLSAGSDITQNYPYSNDGTKVILYVPKFKHEEKIDLTAVVSAAGFGSLFGPDGLKGMVPAGPAVPGQPRNGAYVSKFEQIIFTEFDEEGAEVRAVTFATVVPTAAMPMREREITIRFDRPFHYRITKDGSTLLQGYYEGL